jgi:hypothetical protein
MPRGIDTPEQILLLLLSLAASVAFAWWSYRGTENLSSPRLRTLILLRGTALFLLLLLLFNPVLRQTRVLTERPVIGILLDNSRSVTLSKGSYEGKDSYLGAIQALSPGDTSTVSYRIYGFDSELFRPETLVPDLNGTATDISNALTAIQQAEPDMQALVVYTDGIFNRGRDPSFTASRFTIPVITVGLGDTTRIRDLIVRDMIINDTGYRNTITPIIGEIINDGFPDTGFEVQLRRNGEVTDRETISTTSVRSVHRVQFNTGLDETGLHVYEIYVPGIPGEWTTVNNRASGAIEVLDDQLRILHIAFEIHPDVGAIRHLLATDENVSLSTLNWYGGERFHGGPLPPAQTDTLDLVILHGFPPPGMPDQVTDTIIELMDRTPGIVFRTPASDKRELTRRMGNRLPIVTNRLTPAPAVQITEVEQFRDHPVMDLPRTDLSRIPLVRAPITGLEASIGSVELFRARFRNEETSAPVISLMTTGNRRSAQINAYELFRIFQSPNQEHREFISSLISNIVKWTSNEPDNRLLAISPARPVFDENETVRIDATLRNESGDPEPDGIISLTVRQNDEITGTYTMMNRGLGRYELRLPGLPAGQYHYEAQARRGGSRIDEQAGSFRISETNLEYVETRRNDELLAWIARETGGAFITHEQAEELRGILDNLGVTETIESEVVTERPLYHSPYWFILLLMLLSAEWLIRKSSALA